MPLRPLVWKAAKQRAARQQPPLSRKMLSPKARRMGTKTRTTSMPRKAKTAILLQSLLLETERKRLPRPVQLALFVRNAQRATILSQATLSRHRNGKKLQEGASRAPRQTMQRRRRRTAASLCLLPLRIAKRVPSAANRNLRETSPPLNGNVAWGQGGAPHVSQRAFNGSLAPWRPLFRQRHVLDVAPASHTPIFLPTNGKRAPESGAARTVSRKA